MPGIVETVPSFRSLLILYEPEVIGADALIEALTALILEGLTARPAGGGSAGGGTGAGRAWTVPVAYGHPDGDELRAVAEAVGLTPEAVIAAHSGGDYQVFLIGFVPGLPVLGGLPAALHLPRRASPRLDIPAGRVMIGGMQGIILPMTMPTGYHALGQTPLRPYEAGAANPFLFRVGDRIRFRPVTVRELESLAGASGARFLNAG